MMVTEYRSAFDGISAGRVGTALASLGAWADKAAIQNSPRQTTTIFAVAKNFLVMDLSSGPALEVAGRKRDYITRAQGQCRYRSKEVYFMPLWPNPPGDGAARRRVEPDRPLFQFIIDDLRKPRPCERNPLARELVSGRLICRGQRERSVVSADRWIHIHRLLRCVETFGNPR